MLFNSYTFILMFLPVVLLGFHLIGKKAHHRIAISWLVGASLFFYAWWNPAYLGLILGSILFNYAIGISLGSKPSKTVLTLGIGTNLGLLGYYKYFNFFISNINALTDSQLHFEAIILPLAISFFTFQQITYLVDAYKGLTKEYNFLHYFLFVTFFPQLIAGPIVHHKEMLPQFADSKLYKLSTHHLAVGITIFMLGLFKKVVLADNIAPHATPVFNAAEQGTVLTFFEAWGGALAYTFQLYFDFSGYSDMALGAARMFGIVLPVNFFSPYKAVNIIDFWRRWHITLSRFLRDYLYIPLGGNRKGQPRRYANLIITMLLGGLWHGAGWTFVIWGAMHGIYLAVNHAWLVVKTGLFPNRSQSTYFSTFAARLLTFFAVVIAWVMFRAQSLDGAMNMYTGMLGFNGIALPKALEASMASTGEILLGLGFNFNGMFHNEVLGHPVEALSKLFIMFVIAWFLPNTIEIMRQYKPALGLEAMPVNQAALTWRPAVTWATMIALVSFVSLSSLSNVSEFLYFQF